MASCAIEWETAAVRDGTLVVNLAERPSKPWGRRFRGAVAMLGHAAGDWGEITLKRETITVTGVREGGEERLRHLLGSAVIEASGDLESDRARPEPDAQRLRDARMTDAFRRAGAEATPAR